MLDILDCNNNMTGVTSRVGTYPPRATAFTPGFFFGGVVRVIESLVFCVVLCRSLIVRFLCPLYFLSFWLVSDSSFLYLQMFHIVNGKVFMLVLYVLG